MVVSYRGLMVLLVLALGILLLVFFRVLQADRLVLLQERIFHGAGGKTARITIRPYGSGKWLLLRQGGSSLAASYHTSWCKTIVQSGSRHQCFLDDIAFLEWSFFAPSGSYEPFHVEMDGVFVTYHWVMCDDAVCLGLRGHIQRNDLYHTQTLAMAFSLLSYHRDDAK